MAMSRTTRFRPVRASLADLAGESYVKAVAEARARLAGGRRRKLLADAKRKVDFFPQAFHEKLTSLLPKVGRRITGGLRNPSRGAASASFKAASRRGPAPLSALGYYRLGENGRLCLVTKSEHYHAPLGHGFPGYSLLETARRLGVPNATHNNTRGHITRRLEEELVRTANGLGRTDVAGLAKLVRSKRAGVLNRVINLDTGSLAVEAAVKMMLARFWRVDAEAAEPPYAGRIPVFVVIGDDAGGPTANYHGTTVLTQMMRGMWPGMLRRLERDGIMEVRAVRPDDTRGLEEVFRRYDCGRRKIAGFLHEIVLMNYGCRKLSVGFVRRAHALARRHDAPTLVDEIQSCLWSPDLFTFREYGIRPTFVSIGKGFPGGEYAASRIIFNAKMDCLPQFGALVTNGQEELASLAYLITMRWAEANADVTRAAGDRYEERLGELVREFPGQIAAAEGSRHMAALHFHELDPAEKFVGHLVAAGLDVSVQSYKAECPPAALTKLPLIAGFEVVDAVIERMRAALKRMSGSA